MWLICPHLHAHLPAMALLTQALKMIWCTNIKIDLKIWSSRLKINSKNIWCWILIRNWSYKYLLKILVWFKQRSCFQQLNRWKLLMMRKSNSFKHLWRKKKSLILTNSNRMNFKVIINSIFKKMFLKNQNI